MAKAKAKVKAMTPEVKERLRLAAQAKKGRSSLSGLERSALCGALDALREGAIPPVCVYPDVLHERFGTTLHDVNRLGARMNWQFLARVRLADQGQFSADGKVGRKHIRWVRFRNAPDDVLEAMAGAMETVRASVPIYGGHGVGLLDREVTLFPVVPVMLVLKFLFGEPRPDERAGSKAMNWKTAARKYLTGYTERYVQYRLHLFRRHPGSEPGSGE